MRTTITLDSDLHQAAMERARQLRVSLSDVVNESLRSMLHPPAPVERSPRTGLGVIRLGRPITIDEVEAALDDE